MAPTARQTTSRCGIQWTVCAVDDLGVRRQLVREAEKIKHKDTSHNRSQAQGRNKSIKR